MMRKRFFFNLSGTIKRNYRKIIGYILVDLIQCLPKRLFRVGLKKDPDSILIINTQGIGNMILFTPVLQALKGRYPEAEIVLVAASRGSAEVVSGSGLVDRIVEYKTSDDPDRKNIGNILRGLKQRSFDLGISCSKDSIEPYILVEARAKYRVGFKYRLGPFENAAVFLHAAVNHDFTVHEVMNNLDLLKPLGIHSPKTEPIFYFSQRDMDSALKKVTAAGGRLSGQILGFHAGSHQNMPEKRWPSDCFSRLGDRLIQADTDQILILGGPEETALAAKVCEKMSGPTVSLAGMLTLKETAAVISMLRVFVSNDSGLMHVAAGVGTPVIGLFGPTMEVKNAPWPRNSCVAKVVREATPCSPCYVPYTGNIDCSHVDCLRRLTPEKVLAVCQEVLNLHPGKGNV